MCCRACTGYGECELKLKLTDDCCVRCKYYEECMESLEEMPSKTKSKGGAVVKKKYVKR